MRHAALRLAALAAVIVMGLVSTGASAQQCVAEAPSCTAQAQCPAGTKCTGGAVSGSARFCQTPCLTGGFRDPAKCQWGETCVQGLDDLNQTAFYCQKSTFAMDINLLDTCIYHFIEGVAVTQGQNGCSLQSRLASMMGDGIAPFDIFDLDQCIQTFIDQPTCDTVSQSCGTDPETGRTRGVFCSSDAGSGTATDPGCGKGLYCNEELHRCERECGYIPDRSGSSPDALTERPCARPLTVCNAARGKCEAIGLGNGVSCAADADCKDGAYCRDGSCQLLCALDSECPMGAYCALGQCQPQCFRNLDCADSSWYCDAESRCQPKPAGGAVQSTDFKAADYSVLFGRTTVRLDLFESSTEIPVVIMKNSDRTELFSDPNAVFGYRLETDYGLKDAPECKGADLATNSVLRAKCTIDKNERFLQLARPFGTIYATGDGVMPVSIDPVIANKLDPGDYPVTVHAFFTNGSAASVNITFHKPTVTGTYSGRLSVYAGGSAIVGLDGDVVNSIGDGNVTLNIELVGGSAITWNQLLISNNLTPDREFIDLDSGIQVRGTIDGNESPLFDKPSALTRALNKIEVIGIYSASRGRLRLIGVIDLPADYCKARSTDWACSATVPNVMEARSPFGRAVRRVFQWMGPYDARVGSYNGLYREVISGLAPHDLVLEGGFRIQRSAEGGGVVVAYPLLASATGVAFPPAAGDTGLTAIAAAAVTAACTSPAQLRAAAWFTSPDGNASLAKARFDCYLGDTSACPAGLSSPSTSIFPDGLRLRGALGAALSALNTNTAGANVSKTLSEHLRTQVKSCDDSVDDAGGVSANTCVDGRAVACGLALYRKAILNGRVEPGAVTDQVPPSWDFTNPPVFCAGRAGVDPLCKVGRINWSAGQLLGDPTLPAYAPDLFAYLEHGAFYREVVGRLALEGNDYVADAFFKPYAAAGTGAIGAAIATKRDALFSAVNKYDTARAAMFSPVASAVLFQFPGASFQASGEEWIRQMRQILDDRFDATLEIADVERRLAGVSSEQSFVVAQHALHVDYLQYVMLAALEEEWEGESFQTPGAERLLIEGGTLLSKLDASKNPLGLTPNRFYFASPDKDVENWKYLRNQLQTELTDRSLPGGSLVSLVEGAQESMRAAITSSQDLNQKVTLAVTGYEADLDRYCGPVEDLPPACGGPVFCAGNADCRDYGADSRCTLGQCTSVDSNEFKADGEGCRGADCDFTYECETKDCRTVSRDYKSSTEGQVSCRADTYAPTVPAANGTTRSCARGELGGLMQERKLLEIQRKRATGDFKEVLRQIDAQRAYIRDIRRINDGTEAVMAKRDDRLAALDTKLFRINSAYDNAMAAVTLMRCTKILGPSSGGNCLSGVAATVAEVVANNIKARLLKEAAEDREEAVSLANEKMAELATDKELLPQYMQLDNLVASVRNHILDYETAIQQLFNLDARIADTHFMARRTAQRYVEQLTTDLTYFNQLTGWEGNAILKRNREVIDANRRFQRDLVLAYELVQAVRYELSFDFVWKTLKPEMVYKLVTLGDFNQLLVWVNDLMANECTVYSEAGIAGCQGKQNVRRYSMSLQRAMFPDLTDIIDPNTGVTLRVGDQFHRRITSSDFVKQRIGPTGNLISQIELPFSMWLGDLAANKWVGPGSFADNTGRECDLLLEPDGVSVQIVGRDLAYDIPLQMLRGPSDLQRSCTKDATGTRPIKSLISDWLGTSNGNPFEDNHWFQGTVVESTNALTWSNYLNDRTLGGASLLTVIPLDTPETKLLVDPPPTGPSPQIDDIRIHFKYRAVDLPNN